MSSYTIVQSAHSRASAGRSILGTVAGIALSVGLLVVRLETGIPVPIAVPPAVPAPAKAGVPAPVAIPGGDHQGGGGHWLLIPADENGSCFVTGSINGGRFDHMLLDTGMSGYLGLVLQPGFNVSLGMRRCRR